MTGEITLRGKVLPVGGIKEKVLAARRAGIHTVILPHRNERDLDDIAPEVRQELEFVFVDTVDEVLSNALRDATIAQPAAHEGQRPVERTDRAQLKPSPVNRPLPGSIAGDEVAVSTSRSLKDSPLSSALPFKSIVPTAYVAHILRMAARMRCLL